MARGDSILTPITLDDDDEAQSPNPRLLGVGWQGQPRIDEDGIEIQEHQTEWEQAAAQRRRRREQGVLLTLNRAPAEASGGRGGRSLTERVQERSLSAKATNIIELIDDDEPAAHVAQRRTGTEDLQSITSEAKNPLRESHTFNPVLPESSTQGQSANMDLAVIQTAAPLPAFSPRQSTPSALETPAQIPEPVEIAQAPPMIIDSASATPRMLYHDTSSAASVRDSESTLPTLGAPIPHEPSEPDQTTKPNQAIIPAPPVEQPLLTALIGPGKPTSNNVVSDGLPPIGRFPGDNRERATPSRVNTSSERGGTWNANNIDPESSDPTKVHGSQVPGFGSFSTEGQAIKSMKLAHPVERSNMGVSNSRLPVRSPNQFLTNEPFLAHVHDDHSQAPLREQIPSQSGEPLVHNSDITNSEFSLIERRNNRGPTLEEPLGIVQEESMPDGVNNTNFPLSDPSAQRSIGAPVEVLPENSVPDHTKWADDGVMDDQADDQVKLAVASFAEDDLEAMRSAIDACLKRHIVERHKTHAYLNWSRMMRQRTYQEQNIRARNRRHQRLVHSGLPERYEQQLSPFADMRAIQLPFKSINTKHLPDMSQEIYVKAKPKDTVIKSSLVAPTTKYKSDAVTIPLFKEYVSLENNILADNESKLLATPYFQDEDYTCRETLLRTLPYMYELTHDENSPLDLRKEQCRFYKHPIEAFLNEIGISWNEILYWLLAPEQTIARINNILPASASFRATLFERSRYHIERFERDGEQKKATLFNRNNKKWRKFLSQLGEPTAKGLRIAAAACATVLQECDFSIWYLAQRSEVMQDHIMKKIAKGQTARKFTYRHAMCRVCYQHNCLLHGELREVPEDSWKTDSEDEERPTHVTDGISRRGSDEKPSRRRSQRHEANDVDEDEDEDEDEEETDDDAPLPAHFDDDSDVEKVINYKLPVNPDAFTICPESEMIICKGTKPPPGKFNSNWWLQQEITSHWEKRKPFYPCSHEGSCESAECRCYREGINCEKTCRCSQSCNRRYPGCSCSRGLGKRACVSATCLCLKFNRECDADLCGSCGAAEVLDPVNRYDETLAKKSCGNVAIQRGVPRKTLLGHSEVHGFGLYMGEDIKSGEYIGEYTGEAISVDEGDRRVTIYDYQKTMYLFRLNSKQEVDATYMGNKLRFINNADDKYTNCCPKNLLCNTVFRVALFAITDIKAGTELYFNYNYPKEKTAQFKQPNGKVVAVKQVKQKTKKRESLASLSQPIEDRSRTLAATAKARAVREAKTHEGETTKPTSKLRSGPLQARKAAPGKPGRKKVTKPRGKGADRNEFTDSDANMESEASGEEMLMAESQEIQAAREVRDTDEDDEFILGNTQESGDDNLTTSEATAAEDVGDAPPSRRSGRTRKSSFKISPVVPVKATNNRARPIAGRSKRKRPVIANSDDE